MIGDEKHKVHQILHACKTRDLIELRKLATSEGGLIEDEVRRTACMPEANLVVALSVC